MSCEGLKDIYRGDTVPYKITIKDENGDPINITGSRIRITLKADLSDPDPGALQKDAVLTDPVNGEALLTLSSNDTDIEAREYYYDIEWKDSSDNIRTILGGGDETIRVFEDVTTN